MGTISELLVEIERYCREHDMAESTFGRHAVNDGKFVGRLRAGAQMTVATMERLKRYMETTERKTEAVSIGAPQTSVISRPDASTHVQPGVWVWLPYPPPAPNNSK